MLNATGGFLSYNCNIKYLNVYIGPYRNLNQLHLQSIRNASYILLIDHKQLIEIIAHQLSDCRSVLGLLRQIIGRFNFPDTMTENH